MAASTAGQVITCKAAVAWKPKEPLVIQDIQVDPPGPGEIRIKITHTSLCHTDIFMWENEGLYPRIFGHEAAGIVESMGEGVTNVKEGDHVIPVFVGQCQECKQCQSQKTNLCAKLWTVPPTGSMIRDGKTRFSVQGQPIYHFMNVSSFSEYTVVDSRCVVRIDPEVPLDYACLFGCGVPTGVGAAWNCAKVEKGSTAIIFGLGTVGLAVAEGTRAAGAARIIGVDINPKKFELAKEFGVTECINPRDYEQPIEEVLTGLTDGGADYCFECVGGVDLMLSAFESCHHGWGKTILVGVAPLHLMLCVHPMKLFEGKQIRGTIFGDVKRDEVPTLVDKYMDKTLKVEKFVTHRLPFEKINDAFTLLKNGESLRSVMHM